MPDGDLDMTNKLYDVIVVKDLMVLMRDGVELATDLYFPARDGKKAAGKFPAENKTYRNAAKGALQVKMQCKVERE